MVKARIRERGGLNIRIRALIGGRRMRKCRLQSVRMVRVCIKGEAIAPVRREPVYAVLRRPLQPREGRE